MTQNKQLANLTREIVQPAGHDMRYLALALDFTDAAEHGVCPRGWIRSSREFETSRSGYAEQDAQERSPSQVEPHGKNYPALGVIIDL